MISGEAFALNLFREREKGGGGREKGESTWQGLKKKKERQRFLERD
jgi:hypothetical protein